jgi:hypothetical protein
VAKVLTSFTNIQETNRESGTVGTVLNKHTFGQASMKVMLQGVNCKQFKRTKICGSVQVPKFPRSWKEYCPLPQGIDVYCQKASSRPSNILPPHQLHNSVNKPFIIF